MLVVPTELAEPKSFLPKANTTTRANGGAEGHDALSMQGPSLFGFWDRLTAVLKANGSSEGDGALPCKGLLCSIFFALVLILLWTGKRCDLCLILMRFHAKKANSSAEGDGALPCKGFLCSIFFALVLILLWTVKRKLLFSGRLKDGEATSEKVTNNYHVLRQIE
ncbi:hypothetical protein JHK87_006495 [Glycine soja]|nr:hypothetical protein JHK87_006495 [Glycine soja]